jgi:dipeptidyl aminopeptidase/acylaminoacyl peptidase
MKESIVELASKLWRRTALLRSGVGITVTVVACVGLRLLWLQAHHPAHGREIVAAFGSANQFSGLPQMNHDGSRFIYVQNAETRASALYLCDAVTGYKQEIVLDKTGLGYWEDLFDLRAWPWSPDDSSFIYSMLDKLVICPADTNKAPVELTVGTNAVSGVVWLNPGLFAYVTWGTNLCYARKQADGRWEQHEMPTGENISSLTAAGSNTVAWLQHNFICRFELTADVAGNPFAARKVETGLAPPTNALALWLDASTLIQADGTAVTGLTDLGRGNNDAIPNGAPPTYNGPESPGALNGKGTIHFTAADSGTNGTGLKTRANLGVAGHKPRTVFAVMRRSQKGPMRINIGDMDARFGFFGLEVDRNSFYLPRAWNKWANRIITQTRGWHILDIVYDGTSQRGYIDGLLKGTNNFQISTVNKPVEIGFRSGDSEGKNAAGADGDFAELLVYNGALDAGDQKQVEKYLTAKWFGDVALSAQSPVVWFDPQMEGLTNFSYSKETGQFLLHQNENGRDTVWRFNPAAAYDSERMIKIAEAGSIQDVQWLGGRDCAYISHDPNKGVVLADSSGAENKRLFEPGDAGGLAVTPDGGKLLVYGAVSNEPAMSYWQYDVASSQLRMVVPYADQPSPYAKNIKTTRTWFKPPSGPGFYYNAFPPANFDRHKKYPLVIGNTVLEDPVGGGGLLQPGIAACGAYVVYVSRYSWGNGLEQWETNVMSLYQSLKKEPFIDFQHVYVVGASAETTYLSRLTADYPGLWEGLILLNPSRLPDFSDTPGFREMPKILISAGSEEHEEDRLKKYQEDCLKSGVMVEYTIAPGEAHRFVGRTAKLERTRAMMHFIFEE